MTKNENLRNLIAKDVFGVANMLTHYDVEVSEDLEDFMMDWFSQDERTPTEYTFEELKNFGVEVLKLMNENPMVAREPMVKFPLSEVKKLVCKTEEEMMTEKAAQMECWKDMDNLSAVGGLAGFLSKHASNPELLEAQAVIKAMFG